MEAIVIASSAVQALGAIKQGQAQSAQAQAAANAAEYNATVTRMNADVAAMQGSAAEEQQRRQFRAFEGAAIAAAAQSGAGLEGSNADVIKQNAVAAELDALTIRYESQMKARGLMAQSELDRMQAQASRRAAKDAMTGAYLNAGASLLGGASKAYGMLPQGTNNAPVVNRDYRGP
jgi:hypothetical protein